MLLLGAAFVKGCDGLRCFERVRQEHCLLTDEQFVRLELPSEIRVRLAEPVKPILKLGGQTVIHGILLGSPIRLEFLFPLVVPLLRLLQVEGLLLLGGAVEHLDTVEVDSSEEMLSKPPS